MVATLDRPMGKVLLLRSVSDSYSSSTNKGLRPAREMARRLAAL